jgi:hypothetical protein
MAEHKLSNTAKEDLIRIFKHKKMQGNKTLHFLLK